MTYCVNSFETTDYMLWSLANPELSFDTNFVHSLQILSTLFMS